MPRRRTRFLLGRCVRCIYSQTGISLVNQYATLERSAASFLGSTDFNGLTPATAAAPATLFGAALARSDLAVGWYRDVACVDPWNCSAQVASTSVSIALPSTVADGFWSVTFVDPATGNTAGTAQVAVSSAKLAVALPAFTDSIAFRTSP